MIDPSQLAAVYEQHADRVLLIARSFGESSSLGWAEDAVQDAFVALATEPRLPDDVFAWLVRVTRNQRLQWYRSQDRRRVRERSQAKQNWFSASSIDDRLDGSVVTEALQRLPSPEREIIVMHVWGEMTFLQIAEVVGGSKATANRQFARGMKQLKETFAPVEAGTAVAGEQPAGKKQESNDK